MGNIIPDVSKSSSSSSAVQVSTLPNFLDQWRSIASHRFVLNMVKDHHFQFRCFPMLFHNFRQFSMKSAHAYCPIIQKEVDELLAKGAIEPPTGGAGFYPNIFVVLKCMGGLCPILNFE